MNIWIAMFMAVWVYAVITNILLGIKMERHNSNPFNVYLNGKVKRTKYAIYRAEFAKIGFFIIVAYWLYVWLA